MLKISQELFGTFTISKNDIRMKLTNKKTSVLIVTAGDSRFSGTDLAIILVDEILINKLTAGRELIEKLKPAPRYNYIQFPDHRCIYLEVEKLWPRKYNSIIKQIKGTHFSYCTMSGKEYDELLNKCKIETCRSSHIQINPSTFSFNLYEENGSEGEFMEFITNEIDISFVLEKTDSLR